MNPLTAAIEIGDRSEARALRVNLRITNAGDRAVTILNPDMGVPSPGMNWPFSTDVYRTALLISFGYLSMSVVDDDGNDVRREPIMTSATPALRTPIELAPGDSLEVPIPIGSFYELTPGKGYRVALEYGAELKVSAETRVVSP